MEPSHELEKYKDSLINALYAEPIFNFEAMKEIDRVNLELEKLKLQQSEFKNKVLKRQVQISYMAIFCLESLIEELNILGKGGSLIERIWHERTLAYKKQIEHLRNDINAKRPLLI